MNQNGENEFVITSNDHKLYKTVIFTTNCTLCSDDLVLLANSDITNQSAVPFLLDNKGDGQVKLVTFNSTGRYVQSYDFVSNSYTINSFSSVLNTNTTSFNQVDKHFASIIDLNNDCFADLTILSYK